ncbi:putative signal peptide protein [uncultured Desulfobacterium sp.]|uniref:Putative signal peptide protein n=1 Tax=uncultured Desulfobacterium sp. TaxID=201089 RepID=A0A445MTI0_9BACT|nr:putative signal peptide protein [uncultured Desulfobacterium sp.]
MQIDMHYYGVYALARLAGLNPMAAKTIATASQYVDDSLTDKALDHDKSGAKMIPVETAHHMADLKNVDPNDQRYIWVPFHFLPGNQGKSFTERLVCRMDSDLAKAMKDHHMGFADRPFALELMGVTAHVYADTFAHYGFSGVSSRRNRVKSDDIEILEVSDKTKDYWEKKQPEFFKKYGNQGGFFENIKRALASSVAEMLSGALGHGAVLTYPDQPYLHWRFKYEKTGKEYSDRPTHEYDRHNLNDYLTACRVLYDMFRAFGGLRSDYCNINSPIDFTAELEENLTGILALEDGDKARSAAWRDAVRDNKLYHGEDIPEYDQAAWDKDRDGFPKILNPDDATKFSVFRFYQAASLHQHYVLRELLPAHGLVAI